MSIAELHLRRRVGGAVAWLVIGVVGVVLVLAVLLPRAVGGTPYVILTGSMRPSLPPGTLVVTRPVDLVSLRVGAVVTYQLTSGQAAVVTHRIVGQGINALGEQVFRTQGDANRTADPGWIRPVQLRGEQWYAVPYLGHLTNRFGPGTREVVQLVAAGALIAYAAAMFTAGLRDRVRRPALLR